MTRLVAAAIVLMGLGVEGLAQQAAPTAEPGVIAGTLVSADLGRPVRRAQVRLVSTVPRMTRTVMTDAAGHFAFSGLPPGEYTISASKAGFLESVLGAPRPGASMPGVPIRLAASQRLEVAMRIPRGGVISGVVVDEFGDPAFGVPLRAMRFGYQNGQRIAEPVAQGLTDDLGAYRIAGLMPGDYVISAVPRDSVAAAAAVATSLRERQAQVLASGDAAARARIEEARRAQGGPPQAPSATGYVPSYFAGTPTPSAATRIKVGVSEHVGGIDIQLQELKTSTVSGLVRNAAGQPAAASVQLIDPVMPIANLAVWFRNAGSNGRFTFEGIPPGSLYVLRAHSSGGLTATQAIGVDVGDVVDVPMRLTRGVSISGSIDLDPAQKLDTRRAQIELLPLLGASEWEAPVVRSMFDAEGRFAMTPVAPGLYRVSVSGLPPGWTLDAATFRDRDAADYNLEVKAGENVTGGVVTLTTRTSELIGSVTDASGDRVRDRTVVLFPADRDLWVPRSRRIQLVQPGADGRYAIRALPPGRYRVAAVDGVEPGQQFDTDFLAQILNSSTDVSLAAGEVRTHDIRIK